MLNVKHTVFIALGSNLGSPVKQIDSAVHALSIIPNTQWIATSSYYRSKPLGPQDQPDYLNAVVKLSTVLAPEELLSYTQKIEQEHGRERKGEHWGPRTLDLDILLYGNQTINNQQLIIPHYDMHNREFVLYPLFELAPELVFPDKTALKELIKTIPKNNLQIWE